MTEKVINLKRRPLRTPEDLQRIENARRRILAVTCGHVIEHSGKEEGQPLNAYAGLFPARPHQRHFGKPGHDATAADWEECADWAESMIVYDEGICEDRRRRELEAAGVKP